MLSNWHDSNEQHRREARLTAYALGQLSERERAEVESELAEDKAASRTVKDTCTLARALAEAEKDTPACASSSALREMIEQRLDNREGDLMKATRKESTRDLQGNKGGWAAWIVAAVLLAILAPLAWTHFHPGRTRQSAGLEESIKPSTKAPQVIEPKVGLQATPDGASRNADVASALEDVSPSMTVGLDPTGAPTADLDIPFSEASAPEPIAESTPNLPIVGTPIGLPGPPHIPLGAPAGLRRHVISNGAVRQVPQPAQPQPAYPAAGYMPRPAGQVVAAPPSRGYGQAYGVPSATSNAALSNNGAYGGTPAPSTPYSGAYYPASLPPQPVMRPATGYAPSPPAIVLGANVHAGEGYTQITENEFRSPAERRFAKSTFSIDVDTAAYANVRRFLNGHAAPPVDAVRIEELVNYFPYDYPQPQGKEPFSVSLNATTCPWNAAHQLVRIGLKGREIAPAKRPACNLVFLVDVSGSMGEPDKLPLLKQALNMLVGELNESDRVSIVTYAGGADLKLAATSGDQHQRIRQAINSLASNGGTNGSAGIELAYEQAAEAFLRKGANRVILATDGDLNLGVTDDGELLELIRKKAANDVFLTVLGFGSGNLQDGKMEMLADNGNGVYGYVDSLREARRILVEQISGSLVTIAKDVKVQVEFNPSQVASWRLIGYENRVMANRDFRNDKKDAGEIGAGHTVTALYEIVLVDAVESAAAEESGKLKYQNIKTKQPDAALTEAAASGELLTLYLRYKKPTGEKSTQREYVLRDTASNFEKAPADFRFASAVAAFGMLLRNSQHAGEANWPMVKEIATKALGRDARGYRTEFLDLVRRAETLRMSTPTPTRSPNVYQPATYPAPVYPGQNPYTPPHYPTAPAGGPYGARR